MMNVNCLRFRGVLCLVFLLAAVWLTSVWPAEATAKPIVLKAVTFQTPGVTTEGFDIFMKRVNKAAKGELVIKWVGGPEAIPARDQPEAVVRGVIDFIATPTGYYLSMLPEATFTLFSKLLPREERKVGFHDFMVKLHKQVGVYYLGRMDWGTLFHIFTNTKVERPADLKGMIIRVGKTPRAFATKLGIKWISLPMRDVYSALDRKLITGYILPVESSADHRLYEVVKYGIQPGFWNRDEVFLVNMKRWNSLPKHLQDLMNRIKIETESDMVEFYSKAYKDSWKIMEKNGVEAVKFSPEDAKQFLDLANEIGWSSLAAKSKPENVAVIEKMLLGK
jgi:TRAP-type C4-dicarboxylate transport system substrate-binding protein